MHKKVCSPPNRATEKACKGGQNAILSFVTSNYYDIMKEIIRLTQAESIDKQEVVLELDFYANEGSAPALREPPEFKVGITKRYLEGDRPDEPDWFYKGDDTYYEKNVSAFLAGTTDHYQRMTKNHLLTVTRYASGSSGVYRLMLLSSVENGTPLFSDEAYDAFDRAMKDDDSRLEEVFGDNHVNIIARRDRDRMLRIRRAMSEQDDGGASLIASMARMRDFMASDR